MFDLSGVLRNLESKRVLQKTQAEYLLIVLVFLFGFIFYLWVFLRNQLVPMIDGPYYLIQVKSLIETGSLVYGDPPLTFHLLTVFSLLLGDIALGVKVGVSFISALSTIPTYFLMKKVSKSKFCGLLAMLLIIFSPPYIRMLTDFMKNAIGICWLLGFIYFINDLSFSGFKKKSIVLATFFIILTGLTHILVFGVACLFLTFYTALFLIFNSKRRSFLKTVTPILLGIFTFVFTASTFFGNLFTDFNKIFNFLNDFNSVQSPETQIPPPPRPGPSPKPPPPRVGIDTFSLSVIGGWIIVLVVLSSGVLLSIYVWRKREKEALLLLGTTTLVGMVLSFPLISSEWLGRFLLMIVVPTIVIVSFGILRVWNLNKWNSKLLAMVLAVICFSFFVGQSIETTKMIRPSISYAGYLDLVEMKTQIPSNSIIIVHGPHGLFYWIQYVADAEILGPLEQFDASYWESYSIVLGLFSKGELPPIPLETIYVGKVFILAELSQDFLPNSRGQINP